MRKYTGGLLQSMLSFTIVLFAHRSIYSFCRRFLSLVFGSSDIWSDGVLKRRKPLNKLYIWISTNKYAVMNSSFLYHVWGLYHHKCLREEYKGNTIILHIESKRYPKYCPQCGHAHLVKNGFRILDFISLPISGKKVIRCIKVRRYKCKCADCDYDCQERISFVLDGHSYTRRFVRFEAVSNLEVDRTTAVLKSFCLRKVNN